MPGLDGISDFTLLDDGDSIIVITIPAVGFGEGGFGEGGFGGVEQTVTIGFGATVWVNITAP